MSDRPYSRVYHRLMTEYPTVWRSSSQLGLYVQMLVTAEKFYPECAPVLRRDRVYRALVATGLVLEQTEAGTYTILGLEAERARRASQGRNGGIANAVRTHSERGATVLLDETRRDEKEKSRTNGVANGNAMGWRTRPSQADALADIERQHAASLEDAIAKHKQP